MLTLFKGNYDDFAKAKALLKTQRESQRTNQEKKRDHMQGFIDRFKAKSSKARQAQSKMHLVKKLEKEMDSLDLPPTSRRYPKLSFNQYRSSGAIPLKVSSLSKSYHSRAVLNKLDFSIEREDRVCFVGPNGIGKSTLLNILSTRVIADEGSFEWGYAAKFAYFPQNHHIEVNGDYTVLEWLDQACPSLPEQKLRETLARSLFTQSDVDKPISILSGGETARLILAKMMLLEHNVLLFDEPTNHLDMEGTDALIKALQNYPGTLLIVSHNRYFISQIATRIIEMQDGKINDFHGTYEEYQRESEEDVFLTHLSEEKEQKERRDYKEHKESRKLQAKLKKQLSSLEEKCTKAEQTIASVSAKLAEEKFYERASKEEIEKLLKQKHIAEENLSRYLEEWESTANEISD